MLPPHSVFCFVQRSLSLAARSYKTDGCQLVCKLLSSRECYSNKTIGPLLPLTLAMYVTHKRSHTRVRAHTYTQTYIRTHARTQRERDRYRQTHTQTDTQIQIQDTDRYTQIRRAREGTMLRYKWDSWMWHPLSYQLVVSESERVDLLSSVCARPQACLRHVCVSLWPTCAKLVPYQKSVSADVRTLMW